MNDIEIGAEFFTTDGGDITKVKDIKYIWSCPNIADLIIFDNGRSYQRYVIHNLIDSGDYAPIPVVEVGGRFMMDEGEILEVVRVDHDKTSPYRSMIYFSDSSPMYLGHLAENIAGGLAEKISSCPQKSTSCPHTNKKWYESFTKAFWVCSDCGEDL